MATNSKSKDSWTARDVFVLFGRIIIWTILAAACVFFYMRVCKILEEGFKDPELKPQELPLAYKTLGTLELTDNSVQGRCETAGTTSLKLPETCSLAGGTDWVCPDVDPASWRHEWLTNQDEHRYSVPEAVTEVSTMLSAYELGPALILLFMLAPVTLIYMQKLKDDIRDDAVEIQDELFRLPPRCLRGPWVSESCNCLKSVCCCCLSSASLAEVLRVRIVLLALYLSVICLSSLVGAEQHACSHMPRIYGSVDECSATGRFLLIMASECKTVIFGIIQLDALTQYLQSIVMHGIILPCILIPETLAKVTEQIRYRALKRDVEVEHLRKGAVAVLMERYKFAEDHAEEWWGLVLKPLLEAFDPYCLAEAPVLVRGIVKFAMIQRLRRNFERHLVEKQAYGSDEARQYSKYLGIYIKACSEPEHVLQGWLQDLNKDGSAYKKLEVKLRAMLPGKKNKPEDTLVGMPVLVDEPESQKLPALFNCCTIGCPRDPYNRKPGELCCRSCARTNGAKHGEECELRFRKKVDAIFSSNEATGSGRSAEEGTPRDQPRAKRKLQPTKRAGGDQTGPLEEEVPEQTQLCETPGCPRAPWNGQPGEYCCRTCVKTKGAKHGAACDAAFIR